ncbi:MAG: DUF1600 domain-containing protein [Lachnospiraceae bacterium]|nr:DUF1600 domain-containing protein [Lachnospiraceae bacterium]MBP5184560.1 DUF1600 domain-containing protein [Lachnospiraceae bacterium]
MKDPAIQSNRMQCLFALISASIVAVCVCAGVTMNLVTPFDENFDHMGIRTFCMFTVDSNILAGLSMMLCLPYTIDGIRTGYYHLPDWVVVLMHVAVTAVSLTFLVSLFILAPVKGFALIFSGSRFFLHGVCPILCIVAFCFFINSHLIRLPEAGLALIPVLIYATVYVVMVVFIGEENGGWNDFYGFTTRVPIWVSFAVIIPLTVGIILLLRLGHNKCCLRRRHKDAELYREAYSGADLHEVVEKMACSHKKELKTDSIVIPSQTIGYMIENSGNDMDVKEGCRLYLEAYLK